MVVEAKRMADEDVVINRKMGKYGSQLIDDGDVILTFWIRVFPWRHEPIDIT